jgi:hypothetical protein
MSIYRTGNVTFDNAVLAAELTRQNALAVAGLTAPAAHTADVNYFTSVVAAGLANGISVVNEQTALHSLQSTGNAWGKAMPDKTGNKAHDDAVQAATLVFQNAIAVATTQAQAHAADIARLTAIVNSGIANGISVENQRTALRALQSTQNA